MASIEGAECYGKKGYLLRVKDGLERVGLEPIFSDVWEWYLVEPVTASEYSHFDPSVWFVAHI